MNRLVELTRRRVRLLQLLEAAEVAALAPIGLARLHSLAYLADVLSPVWDLKAFDRRLLKTRRSPYYPDLQRELDVLVGMGLAEVFNPSYVGGGADSIQFDASFAIRFDSESGKLIQDALCRDPDMTVAQAYLNELAAALASLPDDEIAFAATRDETYSEVEVGDVVDVATDGTGRTRGVVVSFDKAFPGVRMSPSRRLYMYAQYLGQNVA